MVINIHFTLCVPQNNFKLFFSGFNCAFAIAKTSHNSIESNEDSLRRFTGGQYNSYESTFTSIEVATSHNRPHCNDISLKHFQCDLCPYSTNYKQRLKRHSLVHSGERPYKCEMCDRIFTQSTSLTRHRLIHTGQKPFSCDVCNTSFRQENHLKKHMRRQHFVT